MQWIRENMFLTCLGGALVVCFAIAYVLRAGQDSAFKNEDMKPRAKIARRIRRISNSPPVNKKSVDDAKKRRDGIGKQRDKVILDASTWNKRNYPILKLVSKTETLDAFPHNAVIYQEKALTSEFAKAYRRELYGALGKMKLTTWPEDLEIGELSVKLEKTLLSRRKAAQNRVKYIKDRNPAPTPPKTGDDQPQEEKKPKGISDEDWDLYRLTEDAVSARARKDATDELMLQKAAAGAMFVSPKTLEIVTAKTPPSTGPGPEELTVVFPQEVWRSSDAPPGKLWQAQLNLWITQDILAAIQTTNKQALGDGAKTVQNSAVKHLRQIAIADQYVMQVGDENSNPALTQRATSTGYEIIEYKIVVVMDTAHLNALMHNMITRGEHTITGVTLERLPEGQDSRRYYGVDPVSTVTLAGEVLMRADWTRKIMPLETLRDDLSGVLGTEDQKRIAKTPR